jgi:hypothetical protein
MSKLTLDSMARDASARVVTPQEATELERRNREIEAERKARREAKAAATAERKARMSVRRAELAPHVDAVLALAPGKSCTVPESEFAAVYRVAKKHGRRLHTKKQGNGTLLVSRDCADGLF